MRFLEGLIGFTFLWSFPLIDMAFPKYRIFLDIACLGLGTFYAIYLIIMGLYFSSKNN